VTWTRICRLEELPVGAVRGAGAGQERVLACRVGAGEVCAMEDLCTHDDGPLAQGRLCGDVIECPRHGARFDVRTGAVRRLPAPSPLRTFAARVRDGWVEVDVPGAEAAGPGQGEAP